MCLLALLLACSPPPPRSANQTRPLDERRAIEIIVRVFRMEQVPPEPGRSIQLSEGSELDVDVKAKGYKFGVAYVVPQERMRLGSALPPRDPSMGDALQLVSGIGEAGDARVLVLYDSEYLYDDHVGPDHEATTITAENKLMRDVRDFLVRAKAEGWP